MFEKILFINWRVKYYFWYSLNTTVHKFNNSNISKVNANKKKFVYLHCNWASKSKVHFELNCYCSKFIVTSVSICLQSSTLYFNIGKKLWRNMSLSSTCSVITWNILITIIRFARYQLLLALSTFMTVIYVFRYNLDPSKLEWARLLFNFNPFMTEAVII